MSEGSGTHNHHFKHMTSSILDQFKATAATLNTSELAGAYQALFENDAPGDGGMSLSAIETRFACLEVILDRIQDELGLEAAERIVDQIG